MRVTKDQVEPRLRRAQNHRRAVLFVFLVFLLISLLGLGLAGLTLAKRQFETRGERQRRVSQTRHDHETATSPTLVTTGTLTLP
ncbi:MAG: hypothetical protein RLY93_17955 [Sumerlaeia bacterium]